MDEVERQREWHERAQQGDREALAALYVSMLPLLRSRVRRVLMHSGRLLGGWYGADDLWQDAFLIFHRFVMVTDPTVPLYRVLAAWFERALKTHLLRRRSEPGEVLSAEETDRPEGERVGEGAGDYEWVCAADLLTKLTDPRERRVVALVLAGYTGRSLAQAAGLSVGEVAYLKRRLRARLRQSGL